MTYPQYPAQDPSSETPYQAAPAGYASWLQRVGSYIIDSLVTLPLSLAATLLGTEKAATVNTPAEYNTLYWVFNLLALILFGYNRWYLGGKTGQSWGKKALSLHLVGDATRQPIGAGKAFLRDIAHFIDGIICLIGYLFPLWDAKKQTIADKIVKSVVVR